MTLPDADSLATYGGPYANYGVGPVDPTTDVDAGLFNKLAATAAMASRMVDRCEVAFSYSTGTSTFTLVSWEAVWKGQTSTAPTLAVIAAGSFTITFPTSVQDELLASHTLSLSSAHGWAQGTTPYFVQAQASANVITVYTLNAGAVLAYPSSSVVLRVRAR